uniref:Uncharacterized protein n=1 Tax=Rhizophora mucronata TaxID=61149 RepID=A0A2P2Q688_RHIMU
MMVNLLSSQSNTGHFFKFSAISLSWICFRVSLFPLSIPLADIKFSSSSPYKLCKNKFF